MTLSHSGINSQCFCQLIGLKFTPDFNIRGLLPDDVTVYENVDSLMAWLLHVNQNASRGLRSSIFISM